MRAIISLLFLVLFCGCRPIKLEKHPANIKYRIVEVPLVVDNDTIMLNELRFYEIESAMDAMQLTYDMFGKWNKILNGRYQANLPQLIWTNVNLLNNRETYTICACGTETEKEYFSGIVVLDKSNSDCLSSNYPERDQIVSYFVKSMDSMTYKSDFYQKYKSR